MCLIALLEILDVTIQASENLTSLGLLGPHGEGATFAATTRGLAGRTEGEERLLRKGV